MNMFDKSKYYYLLLFDDEDFMKPVITTLKFLKVEITRGNKKKWIFADLNSYHGDEFENIKKFGIDEDSIFAIYSIQDLLIDLKQNLGHGKIKWELSKDRLDVWARCD